MKHAIVYIHGQGGSASEALHYAPLFPDRALIGFDYRAGTPWEAVDEFRAFLTPLAEQYGSVSLIANSIGAFFAMHALWDRPIARACFISPIVDMEALIRDRMARAGVSEARLRAEGTVETGDGAPLSWDYLAWVRAHPLRWRTPTAILCGSEDTLQSAAALRRFAGSIGAELCVMPQGEHWFHTPEQMAFLDAWIRDKL